MFYSLAVHSHCLESSLEHIVGNRTTAILDNLLRDLIISFIPGSYSTILLPMIKKDTLFNHIKAEITNAYLVKISRKEIAKIATVRRVTTPTPNSNTTGQQQQQVQLWTKPRPSGGNKARGKMQRGKRIAATKYPGEQAHMFVVDENFNTRLRAYRILVKKAFWTQGPVRDYSMDSGPTRHFTTILAHLHSYKAYSLSANVGIASGSVGKVLGKGELHINMGHGRIVLTRVLYMPDLSVNLLSQTRMMVR
ncbi:hypothetical protein JCM3774_002986 [Rhodotorula dairenensis]